MITLLFCYLFDLIKKLSYAQLKLGQPILSADLRVVVCVLAHLNIKVYPLKEVRLISFPPMGAPLAFSYQFLPAEPSRRVAVQADRVLAGRVRRERKSTLGRVKFRQNDLVGGISHFDVHPDAGTRRQIVADPIVVRLDLIFA